MSGFKSTGLNYTQEEIAENGNMIPFGKLHDEICDYIQKSFSMTEASVNDASVGIWLALKETGQEITRLKKALEIAEVGIETAIKLNDQGKIHTAEGTLLEAQKQIKEIMEG